MLKIHSLIGTILCSYGHKVLTRGRTGHGGVAHSYLLNNEEPPECIPSNSNYSLKHILIDYVDVVEGRQADYNVNNLSYFVYDSCRWHTFILSFVFKDFVVEELYIYNLFTLRHSWNTANIDVKHQSLNHSGAIK